MSQNINLQGKDRGGNIKTLMTDPIGRLITVFQRARDFVFSQATTIQTGVETTIVTANADYYHDLIMVQGANGSTNAMTVAFRDDTGGAEKFRMYIPAGEIEQMMFPVPFPQTAKLDNWTATVVGTDLSASAVSIFVEAIKEI